MRRRLTLLVAATMCLVLAAFLAPLALLLRSVARDRAVVAATTQVQGLVSATGTAEQAALRLSAEQVAAGSGRPVTVFLGDGAVLGTPIARTPAVELAALGRSFSVDHPEGREIVVAVQGRPEGTAVVRTFVAAGELTRGVAWTWLVLAGLGFALLLLGLVVADRMARSLIGPIAELSAVSHRLARAELTARARPAGPPELREVAGALNHLAGRIQDLLREEREHVADLSHRLRTPLTSLRLEAESLADPGEAARVAEAVDGVERAITAVIRQARSRAAGPAPGSARGGCDATAVARERVEFWAVLAEDTGREVTAELPDDPVPVGLPADDLAAALDALLGNVFAHTPDGTSFGVALARRVAGGAVLTVTDAGPGLPAEQIQRGASAAGSTGLGLDIARRAAEASGGAMVLDGGAIVRLELGPADQD
ncbi:MAG TPA: HAMP domain-containing sensor histidine kinase [Candidatus Limnocylindrales bacterium]